MTPLNKQSLKKAPKLDILVTRRLTLRPPLDVDAEGITAILQNSDVTRMLTRVPRPYGLADAEAWIAQRKDKREEPCFAIYREKLMGVVSVEQKGRGWELGYWLDEAHWNRGFMTEAARAVLSHSFQKTGCTEIVSGAYEDNPASQRVLEKLGFEFNGEADQFCLTRNCAVKSRLASLTRSRFEQRFGALERVAAA